jgi:hypothetical protein
MPGARDHLDPIEDHGTRVGLPRAAAREGGPAIAGPSDPRLAHAGVSPTGLMHLQRTVGNAAVSALVAPTVQRRVETDEMSSDNTGVSDAAPAPSPASADAAPAAGGPVTSDGGGTTIAGPTITLDAAMTRANGVLHADVIQADTVIAANYTPGAGNLY